MATITERYIQENRVKATIVSADALPADTIEISDLFNAFPHCFLSAQFFDGSGNQLLTGTSGTLAVSVATQNNGVYESPTVASIDASAAETIDWAANTAAVRVVPTSLAGCATWRIVLTCNRS